MSVVICVSRTVGAMARWCAIATVFVMLLVGCHSSRNVAQQVESHKIVRSIDTLVTVLGGEAQMIANLAVVDGKIVLRGVDATGEGVVMNARIEQEGEGYNLVVDAEVAEREVAVQVREEITDVKEYNSEERHHDSSGVPMWVVVAVVAIVLTVICIMRWMK